MKHGDPGADINDEPGSNTERTITPSDAPNVIPPRIKCGEWPCGIALWGLSPWGWAYQAKHWYSDEYLANSQAGRNWRLAVSIVDLFAPIPLDYLVYKGVQAEIDYQSGRLTSAQKANLAALNEVGLVMGILQIPPLPTQAPATISEAIIMLYTYQNLYE